MLSLGLLATAYAGIQIAPFVANVHFSARAAASRWSAPIKSPDGTTAYVLALEPDFDVGHHVVDLTLVLRASGAKSDASNLLDPSGARHELQAYDFAAADLAKGAKASAYGEKRTIPLPSLGLVVSVVIDKAVVTPVSSTDYQMDELDLKVTVDNRKP
jgi:hypothetical protein